MWGREGGERGTGQSREVLGAPGFRLENAEGPEQDREPPPTGRPAARGTRRFRGRRVPCLSSATQ